VKVPPCPVPGVGFVDKATGLAMFLVDDDAGDWGGWLFYFCEPTGEWVSFRKATDEDRKALGVGVE